MNGKLPIDIVENSIVSATQKLGELQFEEEEEDAYYNKVNNSISCVMNSIIVLYYTRHKNTI